MLIKRKSETNLRNERLFVIDDNQEDLAEGATRRTSSPLLERKSLSCSRDNAEYQLFCEALRKPLKKAKVLNKGATMTSTMSVQDESLISGHFFTQEDLDVLNQPIVEDDIKQALSTRILNLLNDSYKSLIRKTQWIFRKKRGNTGRGCGGLACLNINSPECGCGNRNFVDLKEPVSGACSVHKSNNIILI